MQNKKRALLTLLCLTMIISIVFCFVACNDKNTNNNTNNDETGSGSDTTIDGGNSGDTSTGDDDSTENPPVELTTSEAKSILDNSTIQKYGVHKYIENGIEYQFEIGQVNNADYYTELSGDDKYVTYKDSSNKYISYYEGPYDGEFIKEYTTISYYEYLDSNSLSFIRDDIVGPFLKKITMDIPELDRLGDLTKDEITGLKYSDGSYEITSKRYVPIEARYTHATLPCEMKTIFKLNANKEFMSINCSTNILPGYLPPNADSTDILNTTSYNLIPIENQWVAPDLTSKDIACDDEPTPLDYTINLRGIGTFSNGTKALQSKSNGSIVDLGIPQYEGLTDADFLGWFYDYDYEIKIEDNKFITSYNDSYGDVYPKWKQKDGIVIELNGGTQTGSAVDTSAIVSYEQLAGLFLSNGSQTFAGFYSTPTFEEDSYINVNQLSAEHAIIAENTKIYAKYNPEVVESNLHQVIFKPGDLGYKALDVTFHVSDQVKISFYDTPQFVKEGKTLTGWYTDAALTQKYDHNNPVTSDLTLYPKYEDGIKVVFHYPFENYKNTVYTISWIILPNNLTAADIIDIAQLAGPETFEIIIENKELDDYYLDAEYTKLISTLSEIPTTNVIDVYLKYVDVENAIK